jgi:lipoprotein-anchoring transpeptidase ErfK/SrfK
MSVLTLSPGSAIGQPAIPTPASPKNPATADTAVATASPSTEVDPRLAMLDARARRVFAMQVALDSAGFSAGEIDGQIGANTQRALRGYQQAQGLPATGELNGRTVAALGEVFNHPVATYSISAADLAGPFVGELPVDMMKKAELPALGYASIVELLAERFHVAPALLKKLNPQAQYAQSEVLTVPNVEPFFGLASDRAAATARGRGTDTAPDAVKATNTARSGYVITVTERSKTLTVQDASGTVVFLAPVTVGSDKDPLPIGEWKVNGVQRNPTFHYNPDLFWDANPQHSKAKIAAGPNNPVGVAWIDLSKEHYGIHGTPEPSRVGHTQSHGCIRLTNWDVSRLAALVGPGTKVILK